MLPGEPLVTSGPYRYFAHPNYAVVVAEIALLPLALHLALAALIFTVLNVGVLDHADTRRGALARWRQRAALTRRTVSDHLKPRTDTPALATWAGFLLMCLGMFMAILDIQVVATSLPTIQARPGDRAGPDELDPDRLSDRRSHRDSAHRTSDAHRCRMRWLFVGAVTLFTLARSAARCSSGFAALDRWRVLQGFAGGMLIPAVFTAVFIVIPESASQAAATTLAGLLAVLAPTIGPTVGGWITQTYSWHWLFLINVVPGIVAAGARRRLPAARRRSQPELLRRLDFGGAGASRRGSRRARARAEGSAHRGAGCSAIAARSFAATLVAGSRSRAGRSPGRSLDRSQTTLRDRTSPLPAC